MIEKIQSLDWAVLYWIQNNLACPLLDYLMPKVTALGNGGVLWILIGVVLVGTKRYRRYGITMLVGLLMGVVVGNLVIKNLIGRSRPSWLEPTFTLLIANPTDYSFPSGHTLASVISAIILTLSNKKFGFIAIPVAILIAVSRLYLYVHFPSDVLGAAILGLIIGGFVFYLVKKLIPEGKVEL